MRTIKFRAWDESQKYMAYQGTPDLETLQSFIFHFGDKPLMQFTGLFDKNANPIYEGDIIQNHEYKNSFYTGEIMFSHGVFGAEWLRNKKGKLMINGLGQLHNLKTLDDDTLTRYVVIGNIHENPELLTI
jgi:uncharacterized phage protein (TIGR01671 family)